MRIEYEHIDTSDRFFQGLCFHEQDCRILLKGNVKDNLLDREGRESLLDSLRMLK